MLKAEILKDAIVQADIFGTTPTYYCMIDDIVHWADNIPQLLTLLEHRYLNLGAVHEFMELHYLTGTKTMFEGIHRLPPAHKILNGRVEKYFDVFSIETLPDDLLKALESSIYSCIGDNLTGVYLSGGLDTATITALATKMGFNLIGFTMGFNHENDEIKDAEIIAKTFNIEHKVKMLSFDDLINVHDDAIKAIGRPCATYYGYPLAEMASHYVHTVLSGEGADELFGSYQNTSRFQAIKHDYTKVQERMRWEFINKLPFDYLEVDFHNGRANGIETKTPFCNVSLLGYINLPVNDKVDFERNINKLQLRKVVKDLLPESIMNKPKQGFSYPFTQYGKQLQDMANEALHDDRIRELLGEHTKHIPHNRLTHKLGRKLIRSRFVPERLRKTVLHNHPARNLQIYSLQRFLDIFNIEL